MKTQTHNKPTLQSTLFSENSLVVLISFVTLLLQLISFATTRQGSLIYLEGVFPYASLLFAIAIQSVSYFFSNSLRTGIRPLKIVALCMALCCSTYYSYIGIYNSVHSPTSYLREHYEQITQELNQNYQSELEENLATVRTAIGSATSLVTAKYTALGNRQQQLEAFRNDLESLKENKTSYTNKLRAPSQASYENYEDYAAAYQAYINTASQGSNAESTASRSDVLSAYGFHSIEELSSAEAENAASAQTLTAALGLSSPEAATGISTLSDISASLNTAIDATASGQPFDSNDFTNLNRLFQAAALCGYNGVSLAQITSTLNLCADVTASGFVKDYDALVAALPEGNVTAANTMDLKSAMDAELLSALIKINSLLPKSEQISFSEERYQITDLYLIPIQALKGTDTRTTAYFCLAVAALIDVLSVLFAITLRNKKPLWKRLTLAFGNLEDYAPYIYGTLPVNVAPAYALADFMYHFRPSPATESDGYMMQADMASLNGYYTLAALLCQLNLAKILPAGFADNTSEILLLKARFIFWVNSITYEEQQNGVVYE